MEQKRMIGGRALQNFGRRNLVAMGFLIWIPAVGAGAYTLLRYSNTPGRLASAPIHLPDNTVSTKEAHPMTMAVFVHPQCSCTRSTLDELAQFMAQRPTAVDVSVYFYAPRAESEKWVRSQLWQDAAVIPGIDLKEDIDGAIASRFGVATSGQVLLYSANGQLLFNGGITESRGHVGDNDGLDAVLSIIHSRSPGYRTTPVFGCGFGRKK